jgi:hypothetical protein
MDGQGNDPAGWTERFDLAYRFIAIQDRHFQIHQDYLGTEGLCQADGFQAISSFTDDLDIPSQSQKGPQILSHSFDIIDNQYPDFSHALNIRVQADPHIWRQVEIAFILQGELWSPSRDVSLHLQS